MTYASVKAASQCDFNLKIAKEIKEVPIETEITAKAMTTHSHEAVN